MNKAQAIALCVALGIEPFAPVGKVERWEAVIAATAEPKPTETSETKKDPAQ